MLFIPTDGTIAVKQNAAPPILISSK